MTLTRDEVIRLANEAGFRVFGPTPGVQMQPLAYVDTYDDLFQIITKLAQACYDAGSEAENEACANLSVEWGDARLDDHGGNACRNLAIAIRERRKPNG